MEQSCDLEVGQRVRVPADRVDGVICSPKSTLGYPGGIYCVEFTGADGHKQRKWFHAAGIEPATTTGSSHT